MLKTGSDYLAGLRDGRRVYLGGECVRDVTAHPAFRNAAHSYARLYDARQEPGWRDVLTYEEAGERYPTYYLKPRCQTDLVRRTRASEVIADLTFGMMGRSPDFIGGYVTGAAMQPEIFGPRFAENVCRYYEHARSQDVFLSHAVTPAPGSRDSKFSGRNADAQASFAVVRETDAGVIVRGTKMLATSAAFSDEIWMGNIQPLAPGREAESLTCVVPCNAPGLSLWSRKSYERHAVSVMDNPMSSLFDESDCIVVCEDVLVPWERVFTHNDIALSRGIYFETPAHTLSNHQSGVRYRAKIRLLLGIARRLAQLNGNMTVPSVVDELGHLAAQYGMIGAMIDGQIQSFESVGDGFVNYNRHYMYASIYFATQNYDAICAKVRELAGGSVLQMPADLSVLDNPDTARLFAEWWSLPSGTAMERYKATKLAWDVLGTDFAQRHAQYERFYMGPAFVVRAHNSRECDWGQIDGFIDDLLGRYGPDQPATSDPVKESALRAAE